MRRPQRVGSRGRKGLVSTISPVAVGVILAFAWNMTMTHPQGAPEKESGVTLEVGLTVDEAAAQAWASATPRTAAPRTAAPRTVTAGTATAGTATAGTATAGTATAGTVTGGSPRAPGSSTRPEGHTRGSGRPTPGGCHRARPPRTPDRALRVRVVSACSST